MKLNFGRTIALLLCIQLFNLSCSETDDIEISEGQEEDKATETGNNHVIAENISSQVIIKGSTLVEGIIPNQNGELTLLPINGVVGTVALLKEGFELPLFTDSETDIVGAYIEFGVLSDAVFSSASEYYDVDLKDNNLYNRLDVDFSDTLTSGEICYFIAVYDAHGNVSAPQQICMNIVPWGSNNDLVGIWDYTKNEKYTPEGETIIIPVGEEICSEDTLLCAGGNDTLDFSYCTSIINKSYEFKADGTYTLNSNESITSIDFQSTYDNCEVNTISYEESKIEKGKWTYNAEDNGVILVGYDYFSDNGIDESSTYTYEEGSGYISSLTKVIIENNGFSEGWPLTGIDVTGDGLINDEDSGHRNFYDQQ